MKNITIILILLIMVSCSSSYNYNRNNIKNGLYYGKNASFDPTPLHIFVEIDNDSAFVQSLEFIKGMSTLMFEKTLYKLNNNDTIYKGNKSIIFIEDNILYYEYIKGSIFSDTNTQNIKSYTLNSQEKGYRTKIEFDSTNIQRYLDLKEHVHKPFKHFKIVNTYINK